MIRLGKERKKESECSSSLPYSNIKLGFAHPREKERKRVASPKGEALLCAPKGGFWPDDFSKKFSSGFHFFFEYYPKVSVKRGAGTTDDRSNIVYGRRHSFSLA